MFLYLIIITCVVYFGILCEKLKINHKLYLGFNVCILCVLSGLRDYSIGNDTLNYLNFFDMVKYINFDNLSYYNIRYEIGYVYLNKILSFLSTNNQIILISTSILIYLSLYFFIYKYSKIMWLSLFLYITNIFIGFPMGVIRQGIAIAIIMYAYKYIIENKKFKFLLAVILASLFHDTAIFFIIAYPISKIKCNKRNILIFILMAIVSTLFFATLFKLLIVIFPQYSYYIGSEYIEGGIKLASLINLIIMTIVFIWGNINISKKEIDKNDNILNMFMLVSICTTIISFKFNLLDRISDYFYIFSILYIPNVIYKYSKNKKVSIFVSVIIFTTYFVIIQLFRPEWNSLYPFQFFWKN